MAAMAVPASGACFAQTPAATLHTANAEPTEMSISPVTISSVMPSATTSTGRLARNMSLRFAGVKKSGAFTPITASRIIVAVATAASRRYAAGIMRVPAPVP